MTDFSDWCIADTQLDGGILNDLSFHGVGVRFRRAGVLLVEQNCLVVPSSQSGAVPLDDTDDGIGRLASKQYILIAKGDIDVQAGDRFSYMQPDGNLNFEIMHVNRAYVSIDNHVECDLRDLE